MARLIGRGEGSRLPALRRGMLRALGRLPGRSPASSAEAQRLEKLVRKEVGKAYKDLRREVRRAEGRLLDELRREREILQALYDDEPGNRRRLFELRATREYRLAFDEDEPLVSVVIPTYDNVTGLSEVAIPSVLKQTYSRFELIVVGDCAPKEIGDAVASFRDERIVFVNRERRGPYPREPRLFTFVKGDPPFNEAISIARGSWIAGFADDDAMRPNQLETLVRAARESRAELCYGRANRIYRDGTSRVSGEWPPELGHVSLQAAIYHAGLSSFIQHELVDAFFETASDKSLLRRMLRIGVRFHFVDEVLVDYYEKH